MTIYRNAIYLRNRDDVMSKKLDNPMSEAMYYILLALTDSLHGYAIMEKVNEISGGRIHMGPGTLYGILKRLQKENLIKLEDADGRRKIYAMTTVGERALRQEYERLASMVRDGKFFMQGEKQNEQKEKSKTDRA